ncbi:hypothetical protein BIFGAL_02524 [Bifidobacterium gallicum DSM 20093 = LMG 11596]|uniref:Uncharacterized protein n=1 Tax=Bifidobacterium gallicum DSM 20093 = LMG 11596 TaxID=561180 RepID=D1NRX3_9BIFI|nr:hypothetical protein BIFGAL_02524 [Bifidobacterium gallicum DSM 20093 = LMG 11596]
MVHHGNRTPSTTVDHGIRERTGCLGLLKVNAWKRNQVRHMSNGDW